MIPPERLAAVRCLNSRCARLTTRRQVELPPEQCPHCDGPVVAIELKRPARRP